MLLRSGYICQFPRKKHTNCEIDFLSIIVGTVVSAVALNMLIIPAGLLSGGLTGIAH
ncbi:YitT family protein [Psychrobacillus sp. NPDC058041]|uniref:YitT family protein n=1 Tax=Psychrobacillus sp. NPDC058041 TaxID=3346310 RepID=UPI0036DC4B87